MQNITPLRQMPSAFQSRPHYSSIHPIGIRTGSCTWLGPQTILGKNRKHASLALEILRNLGKKMDLTRIRRSDWFLVRVCFNVGLLEVGIVLIEFEVEISPELSEKLGFVDFPRRLLKSVWRARATTSSLILVFSCVGCPLHFLGGLNDAMTVRLNSEERQALVTRIMRMRIRR